MHVSNSVRVIPHLLSTFPVSNKLVAVCVVFPDQWCTAWLGFLAWRRARSRPCDGRTVGSAMPDPSASSRTSISNPQKAWTNLIQQGQFGTHSVYHLAHQLRAWTAQGLFAKVSGNPLWHTWLWRVLETLWSVTLGLKIWVMHAFISLWLPVDITKAIAYAFSFFS